MKRGGEIIGARIDGESGREFSGATCIRCWRVEGGAVDGIKRGGQELGCPREVEQEEFQDELGRDTEGIFGRWHGGRGSSGWEDQRFEGERLVEGTGEEAGKVGEEGAVGSRDDRRECFRWNSGGRRIDDDWTREEM